MNGSSLSGAYLSIPPISRAYLFLQWRTILYEAGSGLKVHTTYRCHFLTSRIFSSGPLVHTVDRTIDPLVPSVRPVFQPTHNVSLNRTANDIIVNSQGRSLLEETQDLDLTIMNGRTKGDKDGDFTFIGPNGSSTIDLCMCNTPAMSAVSSLTIESFTVSSHQPLTLVMGNAPMPIILSPRFKWKPDKIHEYKALMDSTDCSNYDDLVSEIGKAADILNLKTGQRIGKPWFENQLEKTMRSLF
jgi:hypothetical protein